MGDVDAMASHAIAVLENPELRRRMGQAARRRAFQEFPADKMVPQYEAVYERVLAEESAP